MCRVVGGGWNWNPTPSLSLSLSPCFYFSFCRSSSPLNSQLTELSISFGPKMINIIFKSNNSRASDDFIVFLFYHCAPASCWGLLPFLHHQIIITIDDVRNDFCVHGRGNLLGSSSSSSNVMKQKFVAPITCLSSFRPFRWNRFLHKRHGHHNCQISFLPPCLSLRRKKNKKEE